MLAPKTAAKSGKYRKKYGSKRQAVPEWFFDGFCVEDKQPGRPQSLYLSLGILVSNAYRRLQHIQKFVRVGWQHGHKLPSKSQKIAVRGASGRGPGKVFGGFWLVVGLLGSSRRFQRVLGEL